MPVLTEPSCRALLRLVGDDSSTRRRRGVSPSAEAEALSCVSGVTQPGASRVPISRRPSALRRGGGGHSSMASARCARGAETVHSAVDHTQLGPSRPPTHQQQRGRRGDGVGRRPKTPPDDQDERSPAPATAAAALWFQSQRQRQWHCCGARETAQALQHGCGDDCWRSASLAALHARPLALH